jgi:hypothetical protein
VDVDVEWGLLVAVTSLLSSSVGAVVVVDVEWGRLRRPRPLAVLSMVLAPTDFLIFPKNLPVKA